MLARLFEVSETRGKGKGLFARELVPKGMAVFFECQPCRNITKTSFQLLPEDEKNFILKYGYAEADGSYTNTLDFDRGFDIVVPDIAKGDVRLQALP
jgi:hypothetical protein